MAVNNTVPRRLFWLRANIEVSAVRVRTDSLLTIVMIAVAMLACMHWGIRPNLDLRSYVYLTALATIVVLPVTVAIFLIRTTARNRWRQLKNRRVPWIMMARNLAIFVPVAWIYSHIKAGLLLNDATWDQWLYEVDLVLLVGQDPVMFSRKVIPSAAFGYLAFVYKLFIFVFLGSIVWLVLDCRRVRALRLTSALVIGYYVGAVAYHLMPSYGPAFTVETSSCASVSPAMYKIQEILLHHVREVQSSPSGAVIQPWAYIGAFPSLHISHTLILMWFFRYSRIGLLFQSTFCVGTAISTILFGWHYLLDWLGGFVVAATAIWLAKFDKVKIPWLRFSFED